MMKRMYCVLYVLIDDLMNIRVRVSIKLQPYCQVPPVRVKIYRLQRQKAAVRVHTHLTDSCTVKALFFPSEKIKKTLCDHQGAKLTLEY